MTFGDIKTIIHGLNLSFQHVKEAKLLKKLKGGDLVEIYRITLQTVFTPANVEAAFKGMTEGAIKGKKNVS